MTHSRTPPIALDAQVSIQSDPPVPVFVSNLQTQPETSGLDRADNPGQVAENALNPERQPERSITLPSPPVAGPREVSPVEMQLRHGLLLWPAQPTQFDPGSGIRYDFNLGCRILLPSELPAPPAGTEDAAGASTDPGWVTQFRDAMTGNILWHNEQSPAGAFIASTKKYFVDFEIVVQRHGKTVFTHRLNLKDKPVLVRLPSGTLGDSIGWIPYVDKFQKKHGCQLTCMAAPAIIELIGDSYPNLTFKLGQDIDPLDYYATYYLGLFFDDAQKKEWAWQPYDHRFVGLHRTAGYILGVDPTEEKLKFQKAPDHDIRPIKEKYVVIATKASTQAKMWNNGSGWLGTIKALKKAGYRVICIDREESYGQHWQWNQIPHGCEDQTGNRPLSERARWIAHADFFIGLGSGLSWLAWLTDTPVVLVSGFSHPSTEFHTPYRVINTHVCNSCWNDPTYQFDPNDLNWCPRKAGTPDQFECTTKITSEHVINVIRTIPGIKSTMRVGAAAAPTNTKD